MPHFCPKPFVLLAPGSEAEFAGCGRVISVHRKQLDTKLKKSNLWGTESGERFRFGENWWNFLQTLSAAQIDLAEASLRSGLGKENLTGLRFIDVGSGSGLFSLAARRLGAEVYSFDYDPRSVECTRALREKYFPNDVRWTITSGSVLDATFLNQIGTADIVYSWGVLHHTGDMWGAFQRIVPLVRSGGCLYISIYNDQGVLSKYWALVKKAYNSNIILRWLTVSLHLPYLVIVRGAVRTVFRRGAVNRGMSLWYDAIDWLGGYPFEVARPEEVFRFFRRAGFMLEHLKTCRGRMGCNEFVFRRER